MANSDAELSGRVRVQCGQYLVESGRHPEPSLLGAFKVESD